MVDSRLTLRESLAQEIESFLAETGMTPTPFGVQAAKDDKLLWRIRNAPNGITIDKADRVRRFIATYRFVKPFTSHPEALEFAAQATIDDSPLWPLDLADDLLVERYFDLYRGYRLIEQALSKSQNTALPSPGESMMQAANEIGRSIAMPTSLSASPAPPVPQAKKKRQPKAAPPK